MAFSDTLQMITRFFFIQCVLWCLSCCIRLAVAQQVGAVGLLEQAKEAELQGDCWQAAALLSQYYWQYYDAFALERLRALRDHCALEGYSWIDNLWVKLHLLAYFGIGLAISLFLILFAFFQLLRSKSILPWSVLLGLVLALWLVGLYSLPARQWAIARSDDLLLYSYPSAGASVLAWIPAGSCMELIGCQDGWCKVYWQQQEAYVKHTMVYLITPDYQ